MSYYFSGDKDKARIKPQEDFPGIETPDDLYAALLCVWNSDTCAPRMRSEWSEDNRTKGQCSVTAFLARDIFGGTVRGIPFGDGNVHCYNDLDGFVFDLTNEQFGDKAKSLCYEDNPPQEKEKHFAKEEKRERYELLKARLKEYCKENFAHTPRRL
ncbi:MAG: hypothetical protein NC078_01240 [Ruminococcus sp.]|nr:hypothetical protein [Ruminococcus sp.]